MQTRSITVAAALAAAGPALAGGPVNDLCSSATVVPGNTVTYNPPLLNTTGALTTLCEASEDCEKGAAGVNHSVWYSYTPDQDGAIEINTFGSGYDTVVAVFDGCASPFPICNQPNLLACNDDAGFGTLSQLFLNVSAGETYLVKVSDWSSSSGSGGLLDLNLFYRPPNDNCSSATAIDSSSYHPPALSTHNATIDLCGAPESCEFNSVGTSNSVWYLFQCVSDGLLTIDTEGTSYDTILSIHDGCGAFVGIDLPCDLPSELACDDDSGTGLTSRITDFPVIGGRTYLIKVSDYNTSQGGGWLDFNAEFEMPPDPCPWDSNGDDVVDVTDLLGVLAAWGTCPE